MASRRIKGFFGPVIWLSLIVLVGLFLFESRNQLKVETNILRLLPATEADPILDIAFENYAEKNMQQLVFMLEANQKDTAIQAAQQLSEALNNSNYISQIDTQIDQQKQQAIGQFLFRHRHQLVSAEQRQTLIEQRYQDFVAESIELLFSPLNGGLANLLTKDPLLLSYRYSQSINSQTNMSLQQGFLTAQVATNHYVLLVASLSHSPFEQATQKSISHLVTQLETDWSNLQNPPRLMTTGALFYAAEAYRTAEREISTIGVTSLALVVLLIGFTFRSLTPLALTSLAIAAGVASGLSLILLIYGKIHLITLVFGASLIGVAVDYAFHYFAISSEKQGQQRVKKILPAISLGLLSSVVGYLSLLTTPFPGLSQMALFCIIGLTMAFLTVTLFFPLFKIKKDARATILQTCQRFLIACNRFSNFSFWRVLWLLPVIAIALSYTQPITQDNIRQFQTTSERLINDEKKIKSILDLEASNQFYLVIQESPQALLRQLEKVQPKLQSYVERGIVDGFENISLRLPSYQQQSENYRLLSDLYQSPAVREFIELGLLSDTQWQAVKQALIDAESNKMSVDAWLNSELGKPFSRLWLGQVKDVYAAIIPIKGINQLDALSDINENVIFVDKVSKITNIFAEYRVQTSLLLFIALVLIFLILSVRYRVKKSLVIVSAPIFSISVTVILLYFLSVNLTLFNTLALFLVIGIGIDYGLFFAESKRLSERTFLAICLSALTTVFSFGLLALSDTLAIHAFGLTMLIGISCSFLLSPVIGALVLQQQGSKNGSN